MKRHGLHLGFRQDLAFAVGCPRLVQATWVHERMFRVNLTEGVDVRLKCAGSQSRYESRDRSISLAPERWLKFMHRSEQVVPGPIVGNRFLDTGG